MKPSLKLTALFLSMTMVAACAADTAAACTRTLYVGAGNLVLTGRNMDWEEDQTCLHYRMVILAKSSSSRRATSSYQSKIATVMLGRSINGRLKL